MDYPYTQNESSASHKDKCKNTKCDKLANKSDRFCRTCRDYMNKDLVEKLQKVEKVDIDITTRKHKIERLQKELDMAKQAIRDLEQQKFLEKMNTYFENDLVSSDHRYNEGIDIDGTTWTLETHCTIVRVQNIPENLYFGHVTLKMSSQYGEENIWHYGVPVLGAIPTDLKHNFWTGNPQTLKISDFAYFDDIPGDTLLSDIMIDHLDQCSKYFKKQAQWKNQVWYDTDTIGSDKEKATDVLERIKKIQQERLRFLDPSKAAAQHQELIKEKEEKEAEELRKLQERQDAKQRRLEAVAAKRDASVISVNQVSDTPVPSTSTDYEQPARLHGYKEDKLRFAQLEEDSRTMLASSLTNQRQKPKFISNPRGRESRVVEETDKDRRARPIRKAAEPEEKAKPTKHDEELVALIEANKKRRNEAKKIVEDFLKKIEDETLSIKNLLEKEDPDQSNRDSLINECKKLIMYIHDKNDEMQREINIYLEEEEEKDKVLRRIKTSKMELWYFILKEIEKFELFVKSILEKEKKLFSDKYDYQHNPKTITDIQELIQFYTDEYISQLEKWNSFAPFEEDTAIKTIISKLKTKINKEEKLKKLNALRKLKEIIDFYTLHIQPTEEKLSSDYRYDPLAIDDIDYLIEFYKGKVLNLSTELFGLEGKYFYRIRSDIKSILNPAQRLEKLKCLKELNILAEEYKTNIIPIEQLLKTSYRVYQVQNINLLIDYYRDKCLPTLQNFSSLNIEVTEMIRDDITYIKKLINPEQRLEKLYMMEAHNIIQYYADQTDDLVEENEVIIRNIRALTNDDKKKVALLTKLVAELKEKGEIKSTKQLLDKYKLYNYKQEESKEFLKNDAKDLESIFRQRKVEIKTHLANIDPMGPEGNDFRAKLMFLCEDYVKYIDYINFRLNNDQSAKDILELLGNLRLEINNELNVLYNNEESYQNLIKIEEYYTKFIAPEMEKFQLYGQGNVDSLRSYYRTFGYNLFELVINRLTQLNYNDSEFIRKRTDSLMEFVDSNEKLLLLPDSNLPSTTATGNNESEFPDFNALKEYYITFDDNKDENFEKIVRNMMLFDVDRPWSYDESTMFVQHVKDFMSKMNKEEHFSTKSVLKYYQYLY